MADKYKVKVLKQKVFHDGTSMIVLSVKGKSPEIDERFIAGLIEDGCIEQPKGWPTPDAEADADKAPAATKVP
jgi:hypothetical protein